MNEIYQNLLSQKKALEEMIKSTPPNAALEMGSLRAALEEIDDKLSETSNNKQELASARLTFSGKSVIGSHGILADFGADAVSAFVEAVKALAASLRDPLGSRGIIPVKGQNPLLITNIALGSFGFELEEYKEGEQLLIDSESYVAQALDKTKRILKSTTTGTDDELLDSITDTDGRVIEKIKEFLKVLVDGETICAFQYKEDIFRFSDVAQVRSSFDRLATDNIIRTNEVLKGIFLGYLPQKKTFEFKIADREDFISGKVDATVSNADEINENLNKLSQFEAVVVRVGSGKPRYTMVGGLEWLDVN